MVNSQQRLLEQEDEIVVMVRNHLPNHWHDLGRSC